MDKIIIDTDIGVDDAVAVRYGMLSFEVLGYTCTYGNVCVEQAVKNLRLALKHYGVDIPVLKGASRPLFRSPLPFYGHIHGKDGLGEFYENNLSTDAPDAVHFIIEMAHKYPGEITLVTLGPLTTLAIALNLCPELPSLLKGVVSMGGAFGSGGHSGNMTSFAEFNIYNDPEAAEVVFASSLNLTLVPLDVTHRVVITATEIASTRDEFLQNISAFYIKFSKNYQNFSGMCVHDAQTISYLLHPEHYQVQSTPVAVSTQGMTDGQTLRPLSSFNFATDRFKGRPAHNICLDVDAEFIKASMLKALSV